MSVTRINEFHASAGSEDALSKRLLQIAADIAALPGCQSCHALKSEKDGARMIILEVWDDVEAHKAAVGQIQQGDIQEFMKLLDARPSGEYFDTLQ